MDTNPNPRELMIGRLQRTLEGAYRLAEAKGLPLALRPILHTLRPRLARSLAAEPERAIAVCVWLWARLPEVIGEAVDLTDHARVAAIVQAVEQRELNLQPTPAPSSPPDEAGAPT